MRQMQTSSVMSCIQDRLEFGSTNNIKIIWLIQSFDILDDYKSSLINGENPEEDNPQQAERQLQRLSEKTPKGDATVRPTAITRRNRRDKQK